MKKIFGLFIFFFLCLTFFEPHIASKNANCFKETNVKENLEFVVNIQNRKLSYFSQELLKNQKLSKYQKQIIANNENRMSEYEKIKDFGLSEKETICFLFPETKILYDMLSEKFGKDAKDSEIKVQKNRCDIVFVCGELGEYIDSVDFFNDIFCALKNYKRKININISKKKYSSQNVKKEDYVEKGCFSTNFETSSPERKKNIKKALSSFDGIILEEGEILSFNEVTGARTEENGYSKAKIISAGTFVDGFGGGVCQVSTTLYNACLLAGLEIVNVNSHSLPVSYVEPGFDAMVNSGSSDLVIRNNTNGKVIITTSDINDKCKVKIFGKKNKYKITRISEKTKIIPAKEEKKDSDYLKYGLSDMQIGEQKRLSYAKDGFYANGYLNYYNENGELFETKKIRESKYYPTEGIVVVREN